MPFSAKKGFSSETLAINHLGTSSFSKICKNRKCDVLRNIMSRGTMTLRTRTGQKAAIFIAGLMLCVGAQSLSLVEAVKQTLRTNPEMMAARNELASRNFEVDQARSGWLPQVSVSAGVGSETRNAPATGNQDVDLTRQELGVQARQVIFDGFATSSEVKRQSARVTSADYEALATAEQLALKVSEAYLNVLRHAELLDLTRDTLWEHKNIYDQMKLRSDTGVGSKADLDQIAARLALANSNMIVAQNNLADAQSAYYRLTGVYPNLDGMAKPEMLGGLPANKQTAVNRAISNHPTLQSALADVDAASAQHEAAKSSVWPRLQLEADKRWDTDVGGIEGDDEDLIVAVRLTYDIYSGGANKARRKQTAYLMEEARDIRNNTRRQVVESMQLSWNAYEALSQQEKFLMDHVRAATDTKSAYAKQFNIGRRTLLDLLNTETEVVEARRSLINAEYDRLYSVYRIFNASGSLLSSLKVDPEI